MASPHHYSVRPLQASDLDACLRVLEEATPDSIPVPAPTRADLATRYLTGHAEAGAAVAAIGPDGALVGYAAFDTFEFHGEQAAFCPIAGHAAVPACAPDAYEALYTNLARRWVADGVLKHLVSVPASRQEVEQRFFDIGFGRYVVDAYMPMDEHAGRSSVRETGDAGEHRALAIPGVTVRRATRSDAGELRRLLDESTAWYAASPIFLRMDRTSAAEAEELVSRDDAAIFLAERDGDAIGFMGVQLVDRPSAVALTAPGDATLDGFGAYLVPGARGAGLGDVLLDRCVRWAAGHGARLLHVDYESANPAARSYWPKRFVPGAHSLMRHTHPDMQED